MLSKIEIISFIVCNLLIFVDIKLRLKVEELHKSGITLIHVPSWWDGAKERWSLATLLEYFMLTTLY